MFEDLDLFVILLVGVTGMIGLNLIMNYYFLRFKLQRNIHYSNIFFFKVKKTTMKLILIIDFVILIIATISMIFDSRLFILLFIIIYLITVYPAMGRLLIKTRKEILDERKR